MRALAVSAVAAAAVLWAVPAALAADPPVVTPFPAAHAGDVFVAAQTLTTEGAVHNQFAPGSTIVFRAYAVNGKTRKFVARKQAKYFYVAIPNAGTIKMAYGPKAPGASGRYTWTATWTVPADYKLGIVDFKVLVRTKGRLLGSFQQIPVPSSQLTVTKTPMAPPGSGPGPVGGAGSSLALGLYADAVNGTRPAGAPPRPVGCTQTNVFKRGEQLVVRTWGFDLATGGILTMESVTDAHFTVPGVPNVTLNWGAHGPASNRTWFWTNAWQIPGDYPLGDVKVHISFTTATGKSGAIDYPITIIP